MGWEPSDVFRFDLGPPPLIRSNNGSLALVSCLFSRYKFASVLRCVSLVVFCNFCKKFKMATILSKSLYLAWFLRYKHFCVLQFLRKIRKFKISSEITYIKNCSKCNTFQVISDLLNSDNLKVAITQLCHELQV